MVSGYLRDTSSDTCIMTLPFMEFTIFRGIRFQRPSDPVPRADFLRIVGSPWVFTCNYIPMVAQ
eukprot:6994260-Karenia_brevis.AAC.1